MLTEKELLPKKVVSGAKQRRLVKEVLRYELIPLTRKLDKALKELEEIKQKLKP